MNSSSWPQTAARAHSKSTKVGGPWEVMLFPAICLPTHSTLGPSSCTQPHSQTEEERRRGPWKEETSWGHLGWAQRGELSQVTRPRCWEWLELHGETQQHRPALPGITASQLRPGFIINQGQGSQHRRQSCGARRQADGPSLASWPSALPGGGGAQGQAPPLADAEGRASAQKSRARSQSCFGTGDTKTPASPPNTWDMSLTLAPPVPHTTYATPGASTRPFIP